MRIGSENSDNVILNSDSDVPTTSLRKQLRSSAVIVTRDSEKRAEEEESSESESSDVNNFEEWCKTDKRQGAVLSLEPQVSIIDNPEPVVEVMSSVIDGDLIQLLIEQSNLYHSQNAEKWKVFPKTLK